MNIKLRVANLIKKYKTNDPYQLAKELGINVMHLDLPQCVRGFIVQILNQKYIVLNNSLSKIDQKVVLCHELGHAHLHLKYNFCYRYGDTYFDTTNKEVEANEFAEYLLLYDCDSTKR